jgi:hypothetical protein
LGAEWAEPELLGSGGGGAEWGGDSARGGRWGGAGPGGGFQAGSGKGGAWALGGSGEGPGGARLGCGAPLRTRAPYPAARCPLAPSWPETWVSGSQDRAWWRPLTTSCSSSPRGASGARASVGTGRAVAGSRVPRSTRPVAPSRGPGVAGQVPRSGRDASWRAGCALLPVDQWGFAVFSSIVAEVAGGAGGCCLFLLLWHKTPARH